MQAWHSQPENYDAVCSDAAALLAPRSQDRVESGQGVVHEDLIIRRRLSSDVPKWSRDLARCVGVIHFDHTIDCGAADLKRAKMIDRPSGHLTPKVPKDVC